MTIAISLWQPWASLIFAAGQPKKHETRSWAYPLGLHRSRVAIHAAKRKPTAADVTPELAALCVRLFGDDWTHDLPRGAVLGTVILGGCVRTQICAPDADDAAAGDWSSGRFAWDLQQPEALSAPVPWKGRQGWFRLEATDLGLEEEVSGALL